MKHSTLYKNTSYIAPALHINATNLKATKTTANSLFISKLVIAFAVIMLVGVESVKAADIRYWVGGNGTGKDWTNGDNWRKNNQLTGDNGIPLAGDDIVFNPDIEDPITFSVMPASVFYNSLTISRGIIIIASTNIIPTTLTIGGKVGADIIIENYRQLTLSSNVNITLTSNSTATITGTLEVQNGCTYNTGADGAVTTISGLINNLAGIIYSPTSSNLVFNSNTSYNHLRKGGAVPKATWAANSTCNISFAGMAEFESTNLDPSSFNQVFGHLIWNVEQNRVEYSLASILTTVQGNLEIKKTGSSEYELNKLILTDASSALTIGGTLKIGAYVVIAGGTVTAGSTTLARNTSYSWSRAVLSITSGTLNIAALTVGPHVVLANDGNIYANPRTILNFSGGIVNITGDLSIYSACYFSCVGTPQLKIGGNLINNGYYSNASETVTLNGTSPQYIQGTPPSQTTIYDLIINNTHSSGVSLQSNVIVSHTLAFTSGKLSTGSYTLTLGQNATAITGAGTGKYVYGNLKLNIAAASTTKTFEIGDATNYAPLTLTFGGTATNGSGSILASTTSGDHPSIASSGIDVIQSVNRYWTLTNSGVTFGTYSATFTFINAIPVDLDAAATSSNFIVRRFVPNTWYLTNIGTRTTTSTTITGGTQSQFGSFEIGELAGCAIPAAFTVTGGGSYCSGGTGKAIGLTGSEEGIDYQLLLNGSAIGSVKNGAGPAIDFGLQTAAGTYTVLATRTLGGCFNTMAGSAVIIVIASPTLIASSNGPVCLGTTLSLSATTIPGATYTWTGPNGYTSSEQNPIISTNVTTAMAGIYNVNANCASQHSTTVIVSALLPAVALPATLVDVTSFTANWESTSGTGFKLDVSTDLNFGSYLPGYEGLDVFDVFSSLNGLTPDINHYYRIRAYNAQCTGPNSNVITVLPPATYNSIKSGDWNDSTTWEISFDGGVTWRNSILTTPTSDDFLVSIKNGHTVTVTNPVTVDQVTVEAGGALVNNADIYDFSINDGLNTDLLINGILISKGSFLNNGTIEFSSGSWYKHLRGDASDIPLATWDINSTCEIQSVSAAPYAGLDQNFGNFSWNFDGQNSDISLEGALNTVRGSLTIANTGGYELQLATAPDTTFLHVGGNLSLTNGKLTLHPFANLSVGGSTTLGSDTCLILKSDASGTASFIDNGTIIGPGTASIKRYIAPYIDPDDSKFHFLSSPVGNSQAIQPIFSDPPNMSGSDFYKWDEPSNMWINYRGASPTTVNSLFSDGGNFVAGKGYLVAYPEEVTKTFTGLPYTNTSGLQITCTKSPSGGGWNLLGNPFPSALNWDYIVDPVNNLKGSGIDNALYYYDNASANYKYYIQLSGVTGYADGAQGFIPAMQGFMVHANSNTNNTITFNNAARTHLGQDVYYKSTVLKNNILNLNVEGNAYSDQARVCFYDYASANFDSKYDAYKLFSYNAKVPQLYSITPDNTNVAINTLPLADMYGQVPLGFKAGVDGTYTITADGIGSFPSTMYIKLEDKKTGIRQKLNDNPSYSFTYSTSEDANRFILHFQDATSVDKEEKTDAFTVIVNNGVINIASLTDVTGQVNIIDMSGRKVKTSKLIPGSPARIDMQGHFGVYIVNIVSSEGVVNKKVVVR